MTLVIAGVISVRAAGLDDGVALVGELNCTACHVAGEKERAWLLPKPGPKLAELGSRTNPDWVRQYLVAPRKAMPGTTMPDVLHGLPAPEREEAAEALTHFLFSASPSTWKRVAPDKGAVARGESVFHRVGCVACHAPQNGAPAEADSVLLPQMVEKWSLSGLRNFLLDPLTAHPSGRMPAMGLTEGEASDVAHYLLRETELFSPLEAALYRGPFRSLEEFDTAEVASTVRVQDFSPNISGVTGRLQVRFSGWLRVDVAGDYAFHLVTMEAAARLALDKHWMGDEEAWELERTKVEGKLHLDAGWHRLKLDLIQRGSKRPSLRLEWEGPGTPRVEVPAERLRAERDVERSPEPTRFAVDMVKALRGKAVFAEANCSSCHEGKAPAKPLPPLATLSGARGCLAERPTGSAPDFHLSQEQRTAIGAALAVWQRPGSAGPSPQQRIAHTMAVFHCAACHQREGIGGVSKTRDPFFTSNVDDVGDEGRIPPSLDGVGDRLRSAWLAKVLAEGAGVRPYLNTRMPRFGAANVGHLTECFVTLDRHARPVPPVSDAANVLREAGRKLVGTDGLSCIGCHRFARQPAHALHVLDLMTVPERLNEDWFRAFLVDPNRFHPGTRMPQFWPGGRSVISAVLDGETERQHAALWTYLVDGPRAKFPEGLSRKNMELVVGGEAVLYRGKLWEAGFRAIATGFPGQVNAAFDAEEMRLALLWRGRFLDASPHWSVQGMGSIRPLGKDLIIFPHGSALALLKEANASWPTGTSKELGMKFRGYQLDALKRPTFLYSFQEIGVEDFLATAERNDKVPLRRTLKFSGPALDGLYFRLAVGKLRPVGENTWRFDDSLTLRVVAGGKAFTRGEGTRQELLVPISLERMKTQLEVEYAGKLTSLLVAVSCAIALAQQKPKPKQNLNTDKLAEVPVNDREAEFYRITDVPTPLGTVLEAGSMAALPDGRVFVGTRRGEIYVATNLDITPPSPEWKLFASGLTEIFGLAMRDGILYATQQAELTRVLDTDNDGRADRLETVSDAWGWGGEHEFNFGSPGFDKDGAIWTVHGLTGSYTSERLFRGWAMRHFLDGRSEPMCSGLRSPGGINFNPEGDVFYVESQGPWNGACSIKHLKPGGFMGHPAGNAWYDHAPNMGPRPAEPTNGDGGRLYLDASRIPQLVPPAVVFPYKKMGQSASALMPDRSDGRFGPFTGQFFVGDYTLSIIMRADMEKVNGIYQGVCFPFRQGFATGIIGGTLTPGGRILVGGSKRGWPVRGLAENALQRVDWTGVTPFEVLTMRVKPDGFELVFTAPVDAKSASNPASYTLETFAHIYHAAYGSPEVDQVDQRIVTATVSPDGLRVRLVVDHLVQGHIHELHLPGVRDRIGKPLLHDAAYYTLNQIPKS